MNKVNALFSRNIFNTESVSAYMEPVIQLFKPEWRSDAYTAKVTHVRWENKNCYTLGLRPENKWTGFKAGQFVQLTVSRNGALLTRTFSISCSPKHHASSGIIELTIRSQDKGSVTPWLPDNLSIGQFVHLSKAEGDFTLQSSIRKRVFIAGGSGITPIRSMITQNNQQNWLKDSTLLFYVQNDEHELFTNEFKTLESQGLNFKLIHSDHEGLISQQQLEQYTSDLNHCDIYICGPSPMIEATRLLLEGMNIPREQVYFEFFGSAPIARNLDLETDGDAIFVNYQQAQKQSQIVPADETRTLLEIAEEEGLKPVAGCRMGVCHQCICKKTEGRVYNTKTKKYSDTGKEEIQLCLSVPVSNVTLEL